MPGRSETDDSIVRAVGALQRRRVFRDATVQDLRRLVEGSPLVPVAEGEEGVPDGDGVARVGFVFVDDGLLEARDFAAAQGAAPRATLVRSGDLFGVEAFLARRRLGVRLVAQRASEVRWFDRATFDRLRARSAAFRRAVTAARERTDGRVMAVRMGALEAREEPPPAEVVRVEVADGALADVADPAAWLLAREVAANHGDDVLVVRCAAPDEPASGRLRRGGGVDEITVRPARLRPALARHGAGRDYAFVLGAGDALDDELARLALPVSRVRLWDAAATRPRGPVDGGDGALETLLYPSNRPSRAPGVSRWGGGALERERAPAGAWRRECRVVLDRRAVADAWARGEPAALAAIGTAHAASLGRWARALTGRTVGLALGGGGAWGYGHVALIRALRERGVPIDLICGVSFGSLVGAYYCAGGLAGLQRLVEQGPRLGRVTLHSLLSTRRLERLVADDLGGAYLEDLPVTFLPLATDLHAREAAVFLRGPVALGVRASSSAPGLFGPTILSGQGRFVDGGVVDNVPTDVLYRRNTTLRIASNIYPLPDRRPCSSVGVLATLEQLNPIGRFLDATASGSLALHTMGLHQAVNAPVVYDVTDPRGKKPVWGAFEFGRSREIVRGAAADERLTRAVADAVAMARRMGALSAPAPSP